MYNLTAYELGSNEVKELQSPGKEAPTVEHVLNLNTNTSDYWLQNHPNRPIEW